MASAEDTICPPPFLSDAEYQEGGGYVQGRFCGINPSAAPGQRCCLPCPVQDWVYPAEYVRRLKVANYVGIASVALCGVLLLSFLVLPPERSSRHYLTVGVTLAITLFSLPFVIPLGTNPAMCYDRITPNGQNSDASCAWTGALLQLGAMGSAMWILFRALWLHLRVCWDVNPGRLFMALSVLAGVLVPVAFTAVSMTVTGVSYRTGLVCLPNHHHTILTFWAWEVGFAGAALLLQAVTTGYCLWVFVRILVRGRGGKDRGAVTPASGGAGGAGTSSFASDSMAGSGSDAAAVRPQETWRQMRRMLQLQWRQIALTVVMAVESLFYVVVFVAQDTRFGEVAAKANGPAAKTWSACLVLTGGDREACQQYAGELAISQNLVLGSLLLGSLTQFFQLIGTQNFLLLAKTSLFIGWWKLLRHPFACFRLFGRRRGSDLPLTSLNPSEKPDRHLPPASGITASTTDAQDYGITGATPFKTSAASIATATARNENSVSSKQTFFLNGNGGGGSRRSRSRSRRLRRSRSPRHYLAPGTASNSSSSSFHDIAADMPPITVNNPYKLSLPSERDAAAAAAATAEREREHDRTCSARRVGDVVDLHRLYAAGVRDAQTAFNAERPETPPPPPLPLNIAKARPRATTSGDGGDGGRGGGGGSGSVGDAGGAASPLLAARQATSMASSAAALSLPSSTSSPSPSASPAPAAAAAALGGGASRGGNVGEERRRTGGEMGWRSRTPPPPTAAPPSARSLPARSATIHSHQSPTPPPPSHTPEYLHPSWSRAGHGGGAGGGGSSMADLRDAMRGGLALHPVRAEELEGLDGSGGGGGGKGGQGHKAGEAAGTRTGDGLDTDKGVLSSGGGGEGRGRGEGVTTTLKDILDQGPGDGGVGGGGGGGNRY